MKKSRGRRLGAMLLAFLLVLPLSGCGANPATGTADAGADSQPTAAPVSGTDAPDDAAASSEPETPSSAVISPADTYGLTTQQWNSFAMLYHLAITAENIRIAKDNRLMLDEIYTSLFNDINPAAIDETTQAHLKNLRDIIKSYISISVKRERLQYICNQTKAKTIRAAVSHPLVNLSVSSALDWQTLAISVALSVADACNSYKLMAANADETFLMSGWDLDDEETAAIQKNRERAFDYMVDIVQAYGLDGQMTLNEKAIGTFAEICAIESVQQKLRRLESEEETYQFLGNYWLELASCYFETAQYQKCLDCVRVYNDLATGIYRMDHGYVQVLPKAIVAARAVYTGDEYVTVIGEFADAILKNTTTSEWAVRYFAAQVYLDLYARTADAKYMQAAYDIAYDNVTILLDEQRALNRTYLAEVAEVTIDEPDTRFMTESEQKEAEKAYKEEKKRLKEYNQGLKERRKTELPPVYEPLILNCELLFALTEEMHISAAEQQEIEAILQTETRGVFLSVPLNDRYSFSASANDITVEMHRNQVIIPASVLTENAQVVIRAVDGGETTVFDDCAVTKVERQGDTVDTFYATVASAKMADYTWSENAKAVVEITNGEGCTLTFRFHVAEYRAKWILADKVVFEQE